MSGDPPAAPELAAVLATLPELAGKPPEVSVLRGGLSNRSLLLTRGERRWVLRLNRSVPGVDRAREAAVLDLIRDRPWAPRVLRNDPGAGFLLSAFEALPAWTRVFAASEAGQRAMGRWLRELHQLPATAVPPVDALAALDGYLAVLPTRERAPLAERRAALAGPWRRVVAAAPRVLVHLDLHAANVLGDRAVARVIDWEFAGQGQAALDIACYLHYQGLDLQAGEALLAAYGAAPALRGQMAPALELAALLEQAWTAAGRAGASP